MQRIEDDGPVFAVVTDGGAGGTRWVRLMTLQPFATNAAGSGLSGVDHIVHG